MPRMKDCRECHANHIPEDQWDVMDGPYPTLTPRQQRQEHSYCGLRMGGGASAYNIMHKMVMRRRHGAWEYIGTPIHKGRKPLSVDRQEGQ